jgi:quercetin dioxygenase-like cupin family protein
MESNGETSPWLHGQRRTSWEQEGIQTFPDGIRNSKVTLGEDGDPTAPVVLMVYYPPGNRVAPHTHEADYMEIVLDGTQQVGKHIYKVGDVRVVRGGTPYGPLIAGPEGVRVLIVFRDGRWLPITGGNEEKEGIYMEQLLARDAAIAASRET